MKFLTLKSCNTKKLLDKKRTKKKTKETYYVRANNVTIYTSEPKTLPSSLKMLRPQETSTKWPLRRQNMSTQTKIRKLNFSRKKIHFMHTEKK